MSRFLRFFRVFAVIIASAFSAFSAQAYTIMLDDQGAILPSVPTEFQSGSIPGLTALPHKPGYGYAGHWTGPNCTGTQMIDAGFYLVPGSVNHIQRGRIFGNFTQDQTLYACWKNVLEFSNFWSGTGANGWTGRAILVFNENGGTRYFSHARNLIFPSDSFGCVAYYIPTNGYPGPGNAGNVGVLFTDGDWVVLGEKNGTYGWLAIQGATLSDSCVVYEGPFQANTGVLDLAHYVFDGYNSNTSGTGFQITEVPNRYLKDASTVMAGMPGAFGQGTFNTVYAKWRPEVYQVNLATGGNYGTGAAPNPVYLRYGEAWYDTREHAEAGGNTGRLTYLDQSPSLGNLEFVGYYIGPNQAGQSITYGSSFSYSTDALTAITHDNTTIYPYWSEPTTWVTLMLDDRNGTTGSGSMYRYSINGDSYDSFPLYSAVGGTNCIGGYRAARDCGMADAKYLVPPTNTGWVYGGHWTGINGGGSQFITYDNSESAWKFPNEGITQNTTVYAKWYFPVTYQPGEYGTGSQSATECFDGVDCYVPDTTFTPSSGSNKSFAGWRCKVIKENGTEVDCARGQDFIYEPGQLLAGQSVTDATNGISDVAGVVLTATWQDPVQYYTITLSNNEDQQNGGDVYGDRGGSIGTSNDQYIYEIPTGTSGAGWYGKNGNEYILLESGRSIFQQGLSQPQREGRMFLGYYDAQGNKVISGSNDTGGAGIILANPTYNSNTTFTARFAGTYNVRLDENGGEWLTCNDRYITVEPGGTLPTLSCLPTYPDEGYVFDGYYDDAVNLWYAGVYPVLSQVPDVDEIPQSLTARWKPMDNKVAYQCEVSGEWQDKYLTNVVYNEGHLIWDGFSIVEQEDRCPATVPATSGSAGIKLAKWKLYDGDLNHYIRSYDSGQSVQHWPYHSGLQILRADYKNIYRVTLNHLGVGYNASVPLNNTPSPDVVYFWNGRFYTDAAATIPAEYMNPTPVKYGYKFNGYKFIPENSMMSPTLVISSNGSFGNHFADSLISAINQSLTAQWSLNTYRLTLDRAFGENPDGTVTDGTTLVRYNAQNGWYINNPSQPITRITVPTWSGHIFEGYWAHGQMIIDSDGYLMESGAQLNELLANGGIGLEYDPTEGVYTGELTARWTEQPTAPSDAFTITTTSLSAGDAFKFALSAAGDFYVQWDATDNSTIEHIVRDNTNLTVYSHTYTTSGSKTIKIWAPQNGGATMYNTGCYPTISFGWNGTTPELVAGISGSLGAVFPTINGGVYDADIPSFSQTFSGCSNLVANIGNLGNLFSGVTGTRAIMFLGLFDGCSGVTGAIPAGFFSGISGPVKEGCGMGMFQTTFRNTGVTSIPAGLFNGLSGIGGLLFNGTFKGTGITSIPDGLFSTITTTGSTGSTYATFGGTFEDTALTELPENLFGTIVVNDEHQSTFALMFAGNSALGGYVPKTLFAPVTDNTNAVSPNVIMALTFHNDPNLATSCDPYNLTQYITGFEQYWQGHVSCAPAAVFSCFNTAQGVGNGTPNPSVVWSDEIEPSTTLPAGSACTAEHYTAMNYWLCTGNINCSGTPGYWEGGTIRPNWLQNLTQSVNFYVAYTPQQYTMTLYQNHDANDNVTVGTVTETYNTSWSPSTASVPQWTEHTFSGYYTAREGGVQMTDGNGNFMNDAATFTVGSNMNWYAHWGIDNGPFTVTFDCGDGGVWASGVNSSDITPKSVNFGGTIVFPAASVCTYADDNGHIFGMWNCTFTEHTGGLGASSDEELSWTWHSGANCHALWAPVQTRITLDNQGGVWNDGVPTESRSLYTTYGAGVYRDAARQEGMGTNDYPLTYVGTAPYSPTKTVTLTLDFADSGATMQVSGQTYTGSLPLPISLPFVGYYTAASGGTRVIRGRVTTSGTAEPYPGYITSGGMDAGVGYTSNQTWYAHWRSYTPSVMSAQPQWAGHVFTGWYDENGNQITDANGEYVDQVPSISANTTWYAHWDTCSHTLPANSHSTISVGTLDNQCYYTVTCEPCTGTNPAVYGCYTQNGGLTNYGPSTFNVLAQGTSGELTAAVCHPREYFINYENVDNHNATMPSGTLYNYTYGVVATINVTPISTTEEFDEWCTNSGLNENCAATQTIGTTAYGDKTYYAKWSDACQNGYERLDHDIIMSAVYDDSWWHMAVPNFQTGVLSAGTCVPKIYHVRCNKNCDGDTCAACLEDFYMQYYDSDQVYHWHLGGGYNVKEFCHETAVNAVWFLGGFTPVRSRVATDPDGGTDMYLNCTWGTGIEEDYIWYNSYYTAGTQSPMMSRMYSVVGDYDTGNYNHLLQSLSQDANNPTTRFGRDHYTFDGLWTAPTGGIQYIDANGNFANGNGTAYNKVPWPSAYYGNYDARAFQNFFFDNQIPVSSSPLPNAPNTFDVYAHWVPDVYTISLNPNNGTAGSVTVLKEKWNTGWSKDNGATYQTAANFTALTSTERPNRTGYTFAGYYTEQQTGTSCPGTKIVNADGSLNTSASSSTGTVGNAKYFGANATLYACWTANDYEVTLKPNLGTGAHGTSGDTTIYTKYATGVYTDSARTLKMKVDEYPVARPERYFTITYNPNYTGGETWTSNVQSVFKGYFSSASSSTKYINGDNDPAPKPGYITTGTTGGDSAAQGYTDNTKKWYAQWTNGDHDLHLATRDGYVFKGWYNDAQLTDFFNYWTVTITPNADKTLYAKWAQCNWTAGANSTAAIQPMDNQHYPNRCKYRVTCTAGYDHDGESQFDYYGDAGVESGTLPGCSAGGWTITYYDNPAYETTSGQHVTLHTQGYSYSPGSTITLWTPGADVLAEHHASSVQWCANADGTGCVTNNQLQAGTTDNQVLYAKWSCATGYTTYEYDTWVSYLYTGTGAQFASFVAGMCAPIRYHVKCNKNCPTGETCNACLEDFSIPFAGVSHNYHFGGGYDVQDFLWYEFFGSKGGYVPVYYENGYSYNYGTGFAQNYPVFGLGDFAVGNCVPLESCMYNESGVGNYKTFLMNISGFPENSGLSFGATHYTFDGLYAQKNGVEVPYIDADGNFANGNSQGYNYLPWPIGYTSMAGLQAANTFQNFFFDNEIPVSSSPFPDAPYTFDVVAHWIPKEYTINLNTNGGTYGNNGERFIIEKWGETWRRGNGVSRWFEADDFTIGQTTGYNDGRPTRDGYTFMGYYTEQQTGTTCPGTQIIKADGTLNTTVTGISNATYFDNENGSTLYACWESMTYNISYNLNGGQYGTDHPTSATYGQVIHVDNPVNHPHGTFKGWYITNMQAGIQHNYGPTNQVEYNTTAQLLDLSQNEDGTSMQWFQNLRRNNNSTVLFTANWECDPGYSGADCSVAGTYTITIRAGYGVSTVSADGWTDSGSAVMTKTYNTDQTINLSDVVPNYKGGYTGRAYRLADGSAGSISGNTFTVGGGNATIWINASGITTPVAAISGGATKVYNHQNTTLTGAVTNASSYDNSVSFTYQFTRADTENGTYSNVTTNGSTYSVAKDAYHGTKYYKVEVTASGEGSLSSSVGTSSATFVELLNAPIAFNPNYGTLNGTSPLYVPYNVNGNLYSSSTSLTTDTPATVPSVTRDNYNLLGWFTSPNGGSRIYDANGELTSEDVTDYLSDGKWVITNPDGVTLYARWDAEVYAVTLDSNGGNDGSVTTIYEKYNKGWSTSQGGSWAALRLRGNELPTRTGYTFDGFYDANGEQKGRYLNGTWVTPTSNVVTGPTTWYAHWTANTYHIQFNLNNNTTWDNANVAYNEVKNINNPTPVNNETYHQDSFAGWNVTNMESGITHFYGATSSNLTNGGNGTSWDYATITPSIKYFKNLRADTDTVLFEAVWGCVYPYQGAACDTTGGVTVTVNAGAGIASVNGGTGWSNNGTGTITRTVQVGDQIDLSEFATHKNGYTGLTYVKESGEGTFNNSVFTVGPDDAVININATGLQTPVVTLSTSVTNQIYNYNPVTLTASNSVQYDSSITLSYEFAGPEESNNGNNGTWNYVVSVDDQGHPKDTKEIAGNAYLGTRYYKARITATADAANGGFVSTAGVSGSESVTLEQKRVTFSVNAASVGETGGTLGDSTGRYIRYNDSVLYSGATSDTPVDSSYPSRAPSASLTGYNFAGYYTTADSSDPDWKQIYKSNRALVSTTISGWIKNSMWRSTEAKTVYAHWTPAVYEITLTKNNGTGGDSVFYEKYNNGYASMSNATEWTKVKIEVPARMGYDFVGYYDTSDFNGNMVIGTDGNLPTTSGGAVNPKYFTANTTLYAKWSAKTYTVTYNCGIGTGNGVTHNVEYYTNYTPVVWNMANCGRPSNGYYFDGWDVSPAWGDPRPAGIAFRWEYTENQTFTARWVPKKYHITFNQGSGSGGTGEIWENYGPANNGGYWYDAGGNHVTSITLPNWTGHTFNGYVLGGVTYISGTTLPDPTLDFGDDSNDSTVNITLTAQWNTNEYDIDYDPNGGTIGLPSGYTLKEYTKANADAYIDTGVEYDSTKEIIVNIVAKADSAPASDNMLALGFGSGAGHWFGVSSSGKWSIGGTGGVSNVAATDKTSGIQIKWDGGTEYLSIDGTSVGSRNITTTPSATLQLFGRSGAGKFKGNIYFAQVIVDGTVVRNFIPGVNSSNVVGLYDTITKTFFANAASSGSFTAGQTIDQNTDAYPTGYTYGVGAKVYGVPTRAHSVFEGWCRMERNGTPVLCHAVPYVITATTTGDQTLHAKWSCETGYTQSGDKQSCVANTIILDWQENNGGYPELPNGQCTYGGDLTLPGAPAYDAAHVFNGWETYNNSGIFAANTTITAGCVGTYTGIVNGTSTNITARWCPACSATNASCTPDMSTPGTCAYVTQCNAGYHLSPDSQLNVYNTVCIPYTITYDANGHGNGATDEVLYNHTFTTNNAMDSSQFNWDNHIVTAWTSVSGGNFPNLGAEYPYGVQSDTTLRANWGECQCTPEGHATNCSTTSENNACQVTDIVCDAGYTGTSWSCDGTSCVANCTDGHMHRILLANNVNQGSGGTRMLYAIDTNGGADAGVYLDETHQTRMTTNSNPITLPNPVTHTVTYDKNAADAVLVGNATAQASTTFNGYYVSHSGTDQYITGDTGNSSTSGYITEDGIEVGTEPVSSQRWAGQWTYGTVTLPVAYRPGYKFLGWFDATETTPIGQGGDTYTLSANSTLYAHWEQCADGEYCPGSETVDGQTVYNVVHDCPTNYTHSALPRAMISDCYLNLVPGKWVSTAGNGMGNCTQNYYCDENGSAIYYSDETNDGRRTTGGRKSCAADAGSFNLTTGTGAQNISACYKDVTLDKRGGTSGSTPLGGAIGFSSGSTPCNYGTACTLPDASSLTLDGYTFYAGWTDQPDTDCNDNTSPFVVSPSVPDDVDTYYACRTPATYNNVNLRNGRGEFIDTIYATIAPTYLQAMPDVDVNGNSLTVPTFSDPNHPETTYVFKGYFDRQGWATSTGTKYYNADMTSARDWDKTSAADLYAKFYMICNPGYYLKAGKYYCEPCPAGRYCNGGGTGFSYSSSVDKGLSGYIAGGYYSTGGASTATPGGHVTSGSGCYGQVDDGSGTLVNTACGLVDCGYYSTKGGTKAAPTGASDNGENGCLNGGADGYNFTCGKLSSKYFSTGGGKKAAPDENGCAGGNFCGMCPEGYQSSTTKGKCNITACMAKCNAGTQVTTAENPNVNNSSADGCKTPTNNDWWSNVHNVYYGSASPVVSDPVATGVHMCAANYNTPATNVTTDHNAQADCKATIARDKNDGSGIIDGETDPDESPLNKTCSEGLLCEFGDPSVLQQPGWDFLGGWGTTDSCSNSSTQSFITPDVSTYYACKSQIPYTLTYACGDGATGTAPAQVTGIHYDDTVSVSGAGNCAKTGHSFAGWAVSDTTDTVSSSTWPHNITWNYEESKTFTAQWTADRYTIYYNLHGGSRGAVLPAGYTQLEYIESDGTQYIRTNFVPSADFKHTIVFEATASGSNTYVAGTPVNYGRAGNVQINGTIKGIYGNNGSDNATNLIETTLTSGVSVVDNKTTLVMDLHNNATNSILLNGVQVANTTTAKITSTAALRLFTFDSTSSNFTSMKLYHDMIEQNGVLVHNYVPAQRDEDGEVGLYDTVAGVFLTNSGEGSFTAGDPVTRAYPIRYTYGIGATVTGGATRANSRFEAWCRVETPELAECAAPHEITTTDMGPITLHAKWSCMPGYHMTVSNGNCIPNEFTLVYNKNGHGTEATPGNQTCTYGQQISLAGALSETGWTFNGWTIAGETYAGGQTITCNEEYLGVTGGTVSVDVNVTADWGAKCNKITLSKNNVNASWGSNSIKYLYAKTRENGSAVDGKWYKDANCTTEYTSADYARVKPSRTGWTFRGYYQQSMDATDINASQANGANRVITHTGAPTNTGQTFINGLNASATLYAGWAQNCSNSVSNGTCSRTLGENTSYNTSCATGYHYGTALDGVTYNPATTGNTSQSTYYPNCEPDTITITLNKNDGSGTCGGASGTTAGTLTCTYDGTCNTPIWGADCTLVNSGKIFAGWNTAADGTGTQYGNAQNAASIDTTDASILANGLTLYAVWKNVQCNVTNGSAAASVDSSNTPQCSVTCNTGYETNGTYTGEQHATSVTTGQCNATIYEIDYELYGGSRVEPRGYTLLEYVTADGNQYFDTGIAIKKSYEIRSRFKSTVDKRYLYGALSSGNTSTVSAYMQASSSGYWRWGNKYIGTLISLNTVHTSVQNANSFVVDGTTVNNYATQNAFETPVTLALGAPHNADGTYGTPFNGNIYEFRILDGNRNDVMNLVPARRDSDGVVGFYDTVSGGFFASTSGTAFIAGPVVFNDYPVGYTFLDYIQSNGDQIIDTGVMGVDTRVVLDAQYTGENVDSYKIAAGYWYDYLSTYVGVYADQWALTSSKKIDGSASNRTTLSVVFDRNASDYNRAKLTIGNSSVTNTRSDSRSDATLKLFTSRSTVNSQGFVGRIYSAKIYNKDTDELLFDGIPARRNSDGALGIYNAVNGVFIENSGNAGFVAGGVRDVQFAYPEEYTYGSGVVVYGVPVRANSVFEGWCRNAALTDGCTMVPHEITSAEYGDKTLYAKWSCVDGYSLNSNNQCVGNPITIDYQNGGHGGTAPNDVTQAYGTSLTLADAMYAVGYDFVGWQINNVAYNANSPITLNYDTLGAYNGTVPAVAQWDNSEYTVKYNCNTSWTPNTTPADSHVNTGDAFTPATNTCVNPGYSFVGWRAAGESTNWVSETVWPGTLDPSVNPVTFYAQWERDENSAFTVTVNMPANTEFKFKTIASGQFWVDWGDNSSVETYAPATVATKTWAHTYTTAGTYVIKIGGQASGYYTSQNGDSPETKSAIQFFMGTTGSGVDGTVTSGTEQYITEISGKLGVIFPTLEAGTWHGQPRFYRTFKNTSNMTIPLMSVASLFQGISGTPVPYMFAETFDGSGVTGKISPAFFPTSGAPKTALFLSTFRGCTGLTGTIPAALFARISGAPAEAMFSRTFKGCTGLTGIPRGLFKTIRGVPAENMFARTFMECENITGTLSSDLFGEISGPLAYGMFARTFEGCSSLTGDTSSSTVAIPNGLFGTLGVSTTDAQYAFYKTFLGCSALTGKIGGALFSGLTGDPATSMFQETFMNCSNLSDKIPENMFGNMTGAPAVSMFRSTFNGCTSLEGPIPNGLFGTPTGAPAESMFQGTFGGDTNLTGPIPNKLFGNISGAPATSMFHSTFYNTGVTGEIPVNLFKGNGTGISGAPAENMFRSTFNGCSGLTGEIPSNLFGSPSGAPKAYMFGYTFQNCSGLTGTIPSNLFKGNGNGLSGAGVGYMFYHTFYGCSGLTGYVPEGLFGTMTRPSNVSYQMTKVFAGSGLDTVCPCGTTKVDSVFESYWDSLTDATTPDKVSCRVGLKPGEHWYNGICTTECSDSAIDELHVGNLDPYIVLADQVSTRTAAVKNNNTICYIPLASGASNNNLNVKYGNSPYHFDRPNDTPPAGFGQR